jgi:hypothetical protein
VFTTEKTPEGAFSAIYPLTPQIVGQSKDFKDKVSNQ